MSTWPDSYICPRCSAPRPTDFGECVGVERPAIGHPMTPAKLRADAEAELGNHVGECWQEECARQQRLARAALALAELMPHLERLEAAASLPPEIDEAAVAEAEQYAIASLVFAFNAMKESL
jgi:hypothetical protein